ncbi:DUF3000 domain-containing protein [Paenarthrobacter sp. PH39-S1]|uniref:DUF3000 domain-containing protein n=1 Tax=Micrococcaceae TaxID=1268 RepID=UPI0024B8E283|nr:DUF3000 domain-containing protein [Paenarthrobacter sp. PH39-S1]MDJ0356392.1 DUF3000 domain-containing protein [Paenarthrobacter sp. PH39-S1]
MSAIAQVPSEFLTALETLREAQCRSELRLEEIPAPSRLAPFAVALGAEVKGTGAIGAAAVGAGLTAAEGTGAGPARTGGSVRAVHGPALMAAAQDAPELATGRFILLHDPQGSELWDGTFRIVTYIRAQLEPDMGNDAMLCSVAWTWLVDALENHNAPYRAAGGTATRILSESYGSLSGRPDSIDIELRASWTPASADVGSHLQAWSEMICTFAGLPPLPEGVTALPAKRRN